MEKKRLIEKKKDYLAYIIRELRASTALESAIGTEFTRKRGDTTFTYLSNPEMDISTRTVDDSLLNESLQEF